jgi:hypothetical protein
MRAECSHSAATVIFSDRRHVVSSTRLVSLIDVALERFASRDLIASNELLDVLLDLRIAALDDASLEELLEQESQPTPT